MRTSGLLLSVLLLSAAGCSFGSRNSRDDAAATLAAVRTAHDGYVQSINANKVDVWLGSLTDEVVYFVPNQPAIVGKEAVAAWATRYLQEVTTHWTKPVQEFQISGDWAFGRYVYTASDSVVIRDPETDGGGTSNDSGWGLVVYHHERDGRWRVARDAWGSDRPAR
jgi:ketosteroid isomerase-like protein